VGILDWYTVSVALFILATFAAHGASGLVQRTEGPVHERSLELAGQLWKIVLALLVVITLETWWVRPEIFPNMVQRPFGWLGLIGVFGWCSGRVHQFIEPTRITSAGEFGIIYCRINDRGCGGSISDHAAFHAGAGIFAVRVPECRRRSWAGDCLGVVADCHGIFHRLFFIHFPSLQQ